MLKTKIAFQASEAQTHQNQALANQGPSLNRAQLVNLRTLFNQEIHRQQAHHTSTISDALPRPPAITDSIAALDHKALLLIKTKIQQINPTVNRLLQI